MYNPFSGNLPPVKRRRHFIGRSSTFSELEEKVKKRQNTVIMGPEGVGKSSLLNCFFDRQFRIRMAQEEHLLIAKVSFPAHLPSDGVYRLLADAIVSSLEILTEIGAPEARKILDEAEKKRKCETGEARLQETCRVIDDYEYDITLVIDDFENFTSSSDVRMEHHGTMRHLIKSHLASFVVATNYDFNKDSLPQAVSGSFLLMEFSGNELPLGGFSQQECLEYLQQQGAQDPFTAGEVAEIRNLSGGIPALLRLTAEAAWDQKQRTPVMDAAAWEAVQDRLYENDQVRRYMTRWCALLTDHQVSVIGQLLDGDGVITGEISTKAADELHLRRLLTQRTHNGQIIHDCYDFNSVLLLDYCYNNQLTVSNPHDVQRQNIVDLLHEMIEEGRQAEVLELLREICGSLGNVTMPFDFDEALTDEILQQFALNQEVLGTFHQDVQDLLVNGIRVERTFLHVQMKDYAPVYLSFAKAIECHLNRTVVPILKKVVPNYVLPGGGTLRSTTRTLMLGQISTLLTYTIDALRTVVYREAARYCKDHGCPGFNEKWWHDLADDLDSIKSIRNDMPHVTPLSDHEGVKLLRKLFQGDHSFMDRCAGVHDAVCAAAPAAVEIKTGAIVPGTVKKVRDRNAFVDIGADRDAFLYISEIRSGYISDIYSVLTEGQKVKVKIINYAPAAGKLEVSMKGVPQS